MPSWRLGDPDDSDGANDLAGAFSDDIDPQNNLANTFAARVPPSRPGAITTPLSTCTDEMHRALDVVDIVEHVCDHLGADMWIFSFSSRCDDSFRYLLRTIVYEDWERALFYSHRVRSFSLQVRTYASGQFSDLFDTLNLSLPTDCMFPNLTELKWIPESSRIFRHLRLFLTPRMERLSINPQTDVDLSVLISIPAKCPSLKHITIATGHDIWAMQGVSSFVRRLASIEFLDVAALDGPALLHVARMDGLKLLQLRSSATPLFPSPLSRLYFHDLRELFLPTMECATALLTASPDCLFEELTISHTSFRPTKLMAYDFYSTLARNRSRSSVQAVRVNGDDDRLTLLAGNETETYLVGVDILEPLFSCANLQTVSLQHPVGFDLDDGLILACAWHRIEVLMLQADYSGHARYSTTLGGLSAFAKHCPNLRNLGMIFDATNVSEIHSHHTEQQNVVQRTLSHIHVSLSPISEPRHVAEYLSAIFSRLSTIETSLNMHSRRRVGEPTVLESHTKWKEVEKLFRE
ncbi:hypothetical protein B0H11DRAFT_2222339 [Mycena galericulata]|nr:hypothetical protein B0H11DRAFT_2222339 [Mycena galericulata]